MRATRENDVLIRLDDFLRSQLFRQMVDLVNALPSLRPLLPELVQVRVVLDALLPKAKSAISGCEVSFLTERCKWGPATSDKEGSPAVDAGSRR